MVTNDRRSAYWASRAAVGHRELAGRATGTVVVVACGDGRALPVMEAAGARGVIGLDDDPAIVAQARATHATDSIEVVEAELTDLPLVNDTFDTVVSWHGLKGGEADRVLAEVARITRAGGVIGIIAPNARALRLAGSGAAVGDHPGTSGARAFDAASLEIALVAAGLTVTTMQGLAHDQSLSVSLRALGPDAVARLAESTWDADLADAVGTTTVGDFTLTRDLATCVDLVAWAAPA